MKWIVNSQRGYQLPDGYVDLGWENNLNNKKLFHIIYNCGKQKHNIHIYDNSMFHNRETDVITICNECKYIYHTDASD